MKEIMRDSGMRPLPADQRREDPFYAHLPQLKTMLRNSAYGRRAGELRKWSEDDNFMREWDTDMRYAPAKDIERADIQRWHTHAELRARCDERVMRTTYDTSLRALIDGLQTSLTPDEIQDGLVLRDASGRLAFFARDAIPEQRQAELETSLRASLGAYLRDDLPIADASTPGVEPLFSDPGILQLVLGELRIRLLDRRIVGADWVRGPLPEIVDDEPRRIVFASLKGGVGRSTAIAVVAADAARRGRNVLVIDLDLEAPGIGSLLLDADRTPAFGTLDYLVETGLQEVDDRELDEFVGTSALTDGAGLVHVVPVVGTRTKEAPANYMAKLSR